MPPPPSPALPGHTSDHVDCPACESARLRLMRPAELAVMRFCDAAPVWLAEHACGIRQKTVLDYRYYLASLTRFFGEMPLRQIHPGHLAQYQKWRQEPHEDGKGILRTAGPSAINHEVSALAQILERAGLWGELVKLYRPLHVPKSRIGRALSDEDQERLFVVASSRPQWKVAYWCALLMVNTGAGPKEIKGLRLADVDLGRKLIIIQGDLKNDFRERTLPLNQSALWAVKNLLRRGDRIGAVEPEHYLLPGRARVGRYDPTKPMLSWKTAWRSLCAMAGLPRLRPYDLRHHVATKLAEHPEISAETRVDILGHESERMSRHYEHIRVDPKRKALEAIEVLPAPEQLGFNFETNVLKFEPERVAAMPPRRRRNKS